MKKCAPRPLFFWREMEKKRLIHCDLLRIMLMNVNEDEFTLMLSPKPLGSVNHQILHSCSLKELSLTV